MSEHITRDLARPLPCSLSPVPVPDIRREFPIGDVRGQTPWTWTLFGSIGGLAGVVAAGVFLSAVAAGFDEHRLRAAIAGGVAVSGGLIWLAGRIGTAISR